MDDFVVSEVMENEVETTANELEALEPEEIVAMEELAPLADSVAPAEISSEVSSMGLVKAFGVLGVIAGLVFGAVKLGPKALKWCKEKLAAFKAKHSKKEKKDVNDVIAKLEARIAELEKRESETVVLTPEAETPVTEETEKKSK